MVLFLGSFGKWSEAIALFKKTKEICSQLQWSDGIEYAEKTILEAEEEARKEAEKKAKKEAEERAKKVVLFRGAQIRQYEAEVLQEMFFRLLITGR